MACFGCLSDRQVVEDGTTNRQMDGATLGKRADLSLGLPLMSVGTRCQYMQAK